MATVVDTEISITARAKRPRVDKVNMFFLQNVALASFSREDWTRWKRLPDVFHLGSGGRREISEDTPPSRRQ